MNDQRSFLRPKLTGARFEDHAIPLEVLSDLAVLDEMIIEVAKWKYLQANPDRKRSPRRFTEGISLKLTAVEEGSALPVIALTFAASSGLFPPENHTWFEASREAIVSAIAAADQGKSVTEHLPEKALGYFDRLGRSLRDGESMEFGTSDSGVPARLTRETRRRLLASSTLKELTEDTTIRGTVPEADQDELTFEVQLSDGRKVKAPMALPHRDTIIEAFTGYKTGARVLIQGVGRFNRNNHLLKFDSIEHISILDPLDVTARLDEMRNLRDGWLDGIGKAPSHAGLDWLTRIFERNYPEGIQLPYLYPTPQGSILAEWTVGDFEFSLDIDLESKSGHWHSLEASSDNEEKRTIELDDVEAWTWIAQQFDKSGAINER